MIEALFGLIARLIALVLALVFIACTTAVLTVRSADAVLLDPLDWQLALAQSNVYLKLPDLVAAEAMHHRDDLVRDLPADDVRRQVIASLEAEDWKNLARLLLPANEVQPMTETALEDGFAYLEMRRDDLALDLTGLKRNARGKPGARAVEILAGALPECAQPGCLEPSTAAAALDVGATVDRLPDRLPLAAAAPDPDWRKDFARVRGLLGFAPLVLGVLLLGVGLFGARSRAGWLRWTGIPLLIAGGLAIGAGAATGPAMDWVWAESLADAMETFSLPVWTQVRAIADAVVAEQLRHLQFEGGVVALTGLALTLVAFFVPDRRAA